MTVAPLYIVVGTTFAVFIYFLPGFSDPELSQPDELIPPQRHPFSVTPFVLLNYFSVAGLSTIFLTINGFALDLIPFYLFPLAFGLNTHLFLTFIHHGPETTGVPLKVTLSGLLLLTVSLMVSFNEDTFVHYFRLTVALLIWGYLYYEMIVKKIMFV